MEQQFIKSDFLFFSNELIERFLEKIENPVVFLKSCCVDISSHLCWTAISFLKEKYHADDFCLEIARKYLDSAHADFVHKAINILFYSNQEDSLFYYDRMLDRMIEIQHGDASGYLPPDTNNYNRTNEIELIDSLFYKIFVERSNATFYLHRSREFIRNLISNLARTQMGYELLKPLLTNIKSKVKDKDGQAFHVNQLIEILENSYLKENSKEISIEQIIKILN